MSIRAEIHEAVDEVVVPAPMLASRVATFVNTGGKQRSTSSVRRRRTGHLDRGLSILAAALALVLIASVLVGGRVWRDWNAYQVQQQEAAMNAQLATLEARSIVLPSIQAGSPCPSGPWSDLAGMNPSAAWGAGPIYFWDYSSKPDIIANLVTWREVALLAEPFASGPILVRARDLRTNQNILFATSLVNDSGLTYDRQEGNVPVRILDQNAPGPGLVLDLPQRSRAVVNGAYYSAIVLMGVPIASQGCVGVQVDGAGFTERFVDDGNATG